MNREIKNKVGEILLNEFDSLCKKYYHQTLDEVVTELRIRCIIARSTNDPVNLISDLYRSGVLNSYSDPVVMALRKAMQRYVFEVIDVCTHCNGTIPDEWLLKNPMIEYCSYCMVNLRSSTQVEDSRQFA